MGFINDNISILYVEDESITRMVIGLQLKKVYKKVYLAENGLKGLEAFETYNPDVVITDIVMPVMSGKNMLEEIKKINSSVITIVTSACTEMIDDAEIDYIIKKPMLANDILNVLSDALAGRKF